MTDVREAHASSHRGTTVITARALHRLATALAADASAARPKDVTVRLDDTRGDLGAAVSVPVVRGPAMDGTLPARGAAVRDALIDGMSRLAGRRLASVDIRFSGTRSTPRRRVL